MNNLIGKSVKITYKKDTSILRDSETGTITYWDEKSQLLQIHSQSKPVSLDIIEKLEPLPNDSFISKSLCKLILRLSVHFDNIIASQAAIEIIKEGNITHKNVRIREHTNTHVIIQDGKSFSKKEHIFLAQFWI